MSKYAGWCWRASCKVCMLGCSQPVSHRIMIPIIAFPATISRRDKRGSTVFWDGAHSPGRGFWRFASASSVCVGLSLSLSFHLCAWRMLPAIGRCRCHHPVAARQYMCDEEDPGASGRPHGSVIRGRWPRCICSLTHSPGRMVWVMATSAALLCCALVALSSLDGSHSGTVLTYSGRVVNVRDIAAQTKEQLLLNEAGDHYSWNDQQKVIDARKNQKVIITASCMLYLCWSMSQKLMPRIAHNQNSVGGLAQLPPVRVPQRWTLLPLRRPRKLCVQPVLRRFRRHLQRRGQHWVQWSEHVEQRA